MNVYDFYGARGQVRVPLLPAVSLLAPGAQLQALAGHRNPALHLGGEGPEHSVMRVPYPSARSFYLYLEKSEAFVLEPRKLTNSRLMGQY